MITCIKCMKIERPEVLVIERNQNYPLCEKCGVSMVDLVERMPFEPTEEQLESYTFSKEEQDHQIEMQEAMDNGEIVEVMDPPEEKPAA